MRSDRDQSLTIIDAALSRIAHRGDCAYQDAAALDKPTPCDCPRCVALVALSAARDWRFHGAHHERTQRPHWPRETKMQAAWMKLAASNRAPDQLLAQILGEDRVPSPRDWYVATSVIQWLATNVGMTVLEGAGFKYQQWEEDAADGHRSPRRQDRESYSPSTATKEGPCTP